MFTKNAGSRTPLRLVTKRSPPPQPNADSGRWLIGLVDFNGVDMRSKVELGRRLAYLQCARYERLMLPRTVTMSSAAPPPG
eukprot:3941365-Rhodomonas_salina.5